MSALSLAVGSPTLADRFFARRLLTDLILLGAGAALVALSAQLTVPLWPVPITAQTLAAFLVGATLGALRGGLSLALYVLVGALGAPVFSEGNSGFDALLGNDGGFLIGFIPAAALAGWLAERRWDRRLPTALAAFGLAAVVPYVFGLPWLAFWLGQNGYANDLVAVLEAGLFPFVIGALLKVVLAALLLRLAWRRAERTHVAHPDDAE